MALSERQLRELRASRATKAGNRVALAMELAGVTQVQLGDAIGEPQGAVSDVVRARYQTITLTKAQKFARYFGCAIEDLFPPARAEARAS